MNPGHIDLLPSRMLLVLMVAAHLLAAVLAGNWVRPWWTAAILLLAIACSLAYECWRMLNPRIDALSISAKGELMVRQGEWIAVGVSGDSFVSPLLSVLRIKWPGRRFAQGLLLLPDMLDERQYRQLRVWLKWHRDADQTLMREPQ